MVVKIGFIGCGIHASRLMRLVEHDSRTVIGDVYHPTRSNGEVTTSRIEDLYSSDAIVIASPNSTHFSYLTRILEEFPGSVFCEKPPVTNLDHVDILNTFPLAAMERVFFNFNFRHSRLAEILGEVIDGGEIGSIINAFVTMTHGLAFKTQYEGSWRAQGEEQAIPVLDTVAIHFIDLMDIYLGISEIVSCQFGNFSDQGEYPDASVITQKHVGGGWSTLFVGYASPYQKHIVVTGTDGVFVLDGDGARLNFPRDSFDKRGRFMSPPLYKQWDYDFDEDYLYSLHRSFSFFVDHLLADDGIDKQLFELSMRSNRKILSINKQFSMGAKIVS